MAETGNSLYFYLIIKLIYQLFYYKKWSKQVLTIEQNVRTRERLKQQKKYASTLSNGEKALVVRWKQTVLKNRFL